MYSFIHSFIHSFILLHLHPAGRRPSRVAMFPSGLPSPLGIDIDPAVAAAAGGATPNSNVSVRSGGNMMRGQIQVRKALGDCCIERPHSTLMLDFFSSFSFLPSPLSSQVIYGPVLSGKSTELLLRVRRYRSVHRTVLVITFNHGNSPSHVRTHDGMELRAMPVARLEDAHLAASAHDIIAVDDGHCFDDLAKACDQWASAMGKLVIVAALDATPDRQACPSAVALLPIAENVVKLRAICAHCKAEDACFTNRSAEGREVPVCRRCFHQAWGGNRYGPGHCQNAVEHEGRGSGFDKSAQEEHSHNTLMDTKRLGHNSAVPSPSPSKAWSSPATAAPQTPSPMMIATQKSKPLHSLSPFSPSPSASSVASTPESALASLRKMR